MLIGVVSSSYPTTAADPSGSFIHGLSRALARRGHQVEAVCPEPADPADWSPDDDWLEGVRVFAAPYARPRRTQRLFFGAGAPDNLRREPWLAVLAPAAVLSLARETRRRSGAWDAVVSHWLVPSTLAATACRRRRGGGPRHLAVAHSGDVHLLRRLPGGGALTRALARRVDVLGAVSDQLRGELGELLGGELAGEVVRTPMGIDRRRPAGLLSRAEVRRQLGLDGGFTVLSLGRLVPIKGVDVLLEAAGGVPGIVVLIAGDGPERERLEARAARLGVAARFVGAVDARRRAELLAAADCFALPSRVLPDGRHEGLPLALVEAMDAGLPVVAASGGGVPELVRHNDSGLLVPAGDAAALREALLSVAREPKLGRRLGDAAHRIAAARDWDLLAPRYERLLEDRVAGG